MDEESRPAGWMIHAGVAAAGMFGFPYPVEHLVAGTEPRATVDWDAELARLVDE